MAALENTFTAQQEAMQPDRRNPEQEIKPLSDTHALVKIVCLFTLKNRSSFCQKSKKPFSICS